MKTLLATIAIVVSLFSHGALASPKTSDFMEDVVEGEDEVMTETEGSVSDRLALGARFDSLFTAGSPSQQGFAIPSLRLSAYGDLSKEVDYRLSIGQTREFTTVLLPQMLPVEAYLNIALPAIEGITDTSSVKWKFGMFTPTFNPWWTPDIGDLELPDYNATHKLVFLGRDIGTELSYEVIPDGLRIGVGAFNGGGILSLNSNSSKAFTGFVTDSFAIRDSKIEVGISAYSLVQSTRGSINYKNEWMADAWVTLDLAPIGVQISGDFFRGSYEDSTHTADPTGGGVSMFVGLVEWAKLFGRVESVSQAPVGIFDSLRHAQAGPVVYFGENLKTFIFYDYFSYSDGSAESSVNLRLRLTI